MIERRETAGSGGTRIEYARVVGPDPVLLVHGFGSSADETWGKTGWFRLLEDAGRGIIAPDLRAHGGSGKPHQASSYRVRDFTADLAAVLDAEGAERVDAIGYSMGAQVLRGMVRDHTSRMRRLVLGGIGPVEQFRALGVDAVRAALAGEPAALEEGAAEVMRAAAKAPGADPAALEACAAGFAAEVLLIGRLPVPALLAAGDADTMATGAEGFAERLGARFVSVPKRTHITTVWSLPFQRAAMSFLTEPA